MITTRKLERQRRKYKITPLRKGMSSRSPWMTGASTSVRSSRSSGSTSCSTSSCSIWSPRPSGRPAWSTGRWHPAPSWQVRPWTPCSRPGGWKVVGNRPSDAARFLPAYKRDTPRGIFVKDFLTTRQRPATPEEAERLPPEHSTSPMTFQMALNSFHGLADHLDYFDTMDPDNIITAREIFGD